MRAKLVKKCDVCLPKKDTVVGFQVFLLLGSHQQGNYYLQQRLTGSNTSCNQLLGMDDDEEG